MEGPRGVIEAVRLARKEVDRTLVLLGSTAVDDPEADVILETIHSSADERIVVVSVEDPLFVNALQKQALPSYCRSRSAKDSA